MSGDITITGSAIIPATALEALRRKARLAEVPVWKPAAGETLEGVIIGSRTGMGPFGSQPQALIETIEGQTVAVWLTTWLLQQMRDQHAERGDLVSLTFHGRQRSRRGSEFNSYSVTVLKAEEIG